MLFYIYFVYALCNIPNLNSYCEGSQAHHLDKKNVIFMPKDLHIVCPHRQMDERAMLKVNLIAWDYMESSV